MPTLLQPDLNPKSEFLQMKNTLYVFGRELEQVKVLMEIHKGMGAKLLHHCPSLYGRGWKTCKRRPLPLGEWHVSENATRDGSPMYQPHTAWAEECRAGEQKRIVRAV